MESFVLSTIGTKYYWRDVDKEIDFLKIENKDILPIEVKNKERVDERDLNTLKLFMNKYNLKKSLLLYLGDEITKEYSEGKIKCLSFWNWLLQQ